MLKKAIKELRQKKELEKAFNKRGNEKLLMQMNNANSTEEIDAIRKARDELNGRKKRPALDPNVILTSLTMLGGVGLIGVIEHNVGPISQKGFAWLTGFFKKGKGGA